MININISNGELLSASSGGIALFSTGKRVCARAWQGLFARCVNLDRQRQ
jgi:hypothetical protein